MQEKLLNAARERFNDLKIWHYEESQHSCFLRFTANNTLYLLTCLKNGTHCSLLKLEEDIRL